MKPDLNKLKLKWRIFFFLLGFCALLLVILWLFQTVLLDSFYRSIKVMEIRREAGLIADNIDHEELSDLIAGISQSSDVNIEIVSEDGKTVSASNSQRYSVFSRLPQQNGGDLILKAKNHGGEYFEYMTSSPPIRPDKDGAFTGRLPPDNTHSIQSLLYVKLVEMSSGAQAAVVVDAEISPVNATVTTLRYQLYFITAIMVILSILLAFIIAKRVSKPIEEINKSAKELAKGNYDAHFEGKGFLEIGELSDTLNTAASELSKVEALRRELMANISHDLRTPLSLIYSYAEIMHDFPAEITQEKTQVIMDEAQRLSTLVNDVLDISKLEAGIQKLNKSDFNLTASLKTTVTRLSELLKKDGYGILFSYDREISVCADEVKITQVFYNLLINAVNYSGGDKVVTVRQIAEEGGVKIEVADTGEGISPEDLPYIWDRYYKADKKHKRAVTGTGLGLSIVKKVIELHGGECGVESQVGKGSAFWFRLRT